MNNGGTTLMNIWEYWGKSEPNSGRGERGRRRKTDGWRRNEEKDEEDAKRMQQKEDHIEVESALYPYFVYGCNLRLGKLADIPDALKKKR